MHYGDAFRIIQGIHPTRANLVDFFPRAENQEEPAETLLFTSPFRIKAFAANLKAHNGRTKSKDQIELTEEHMTALRKPDAKELMLGKYVLRHENRMLHAYRKPN